MCVVCCEQAWAILEAERGDIDHARSLLRTASEKDPCDVYIWQVCAWVPCCANVLACNTTWLVLQPEGTGVQRGSAVPSPVEQHVECVKLSPQDTLCRACTVLCIIKVSNKLSLAD